MCKNRESSLLFKQPMSVTVKILEEIGLNTSLLIQVVMNGAMG